MTTQQPFHADVLVVHASKSGGTAGIAVMIAEALRGEGLTADVAKAADAAGDGTVAGYRAVVLGSALYASRWRRDALRFLRRHTVLLRERPVWLFQSGPCGPNAARDAERGAGEPTTLRRLRQDLEIAPPVTFGGVLDPETAQGFLARRMARGSLAGDYRDPERIRAWATSIAAAVPPLRPAS